MDIVMQSSGYEGAPIRYVFPIKCGAKELLGVSNQMIVNERVDV